MSLDGMRDMLSIRTDNAFPVYTLSVITDTMIWYIYYRYTNVHNKLQYVSAKHFLTHPCLTLRSQNKTFTSLNTLTILIFLQKTCNKAVKYLNICGLIKLLSYSWKLCRIIIMFRKEVVNFSQLFLFWEHTQKQVGLSFTCLYVSLWFSSVLEW